MPAPVPAPVWDRPYGHGNGWTQGDVAGSFGFSMNQSYRGYGAGYPAYGYAPYPYAYVPQPAPQAAGDAEKAGS